MSDEIIKQFDPNLAEPLPENKESWERIKRLFLTLGVEDVPESWTFILSQLQNTKMPELMFNYINVFSYYKRWKIAKVIQDEKAVYIQLLEDKLKAHMDAIKSQGDGENGASDIELLPIGAPDHQSELQPLQTDSETLVPISP